MYCMYCGDCSDYALLVTVLILLVLPIVYCLPSLLNEFNNMFLATTHKALRMCQMTVFLPDEDLFRTR